MTETQPPRRPRVFASDDPLGVARRFRPDIVQAPASLLDQRLLIDGTLAALTGYGVEVHLRSIFLNGLLFLPADRAPNHLKEAASRISRARRLIAEGRSDPLQAALGFALSRQEAATVLVGVTSAAELQAVIAAASGLEAAGERGRAGSSGDGSRCEESPTLCPSTCSE